MRDFSLNARMPFRGKTGEALTARKLVAFVAVVCLIGEAGGSRAMGGGTVQYLVLKRGLTGADETVLGHNIRERERS